jgi:AraC-like DNA-binding protein
MNGFASALLVGMVRQQLARDGHAWTSHARPWRGALISLDAKRDVLARVTAEHGLSALLRAGRGLSQLPPDPTLDVLLRAIDPHDLLARWQRLERFLHSRHRLVLVSAGEQHLVVRHVGPDGEPPTAPEDALILGVLVELCRHIGTQGLAVDGIGPDGLPCPVLREGDFLLPAGLDLVLSERWRFSWTGVEASSGVRGPVVADFDVLPAPAREVTARLTDLVEGDLGRSWTLAPLARGLGLSERTLQRRLGEAGATLADLIRTVRVDAAARMLVDSTHSLGKIGFACGFSISRISRSCSKSKRP